MRITKVYTKKGDQGQTSLGFGTDQVSKKSLRICAIGEIDELNSFLGLLKSSLYQDLDAIKDLLLKIQHDLFNLGGELSLPGEKVSDFLPVIEGIHTTCLETLMNEWQTQLTPLKDFVLPGSDQVNGFCHICRSVCRRVERSLVQLHETEPLRADILVYINRLSDFFFLLGRYLNHLNQKEEVIWNKQNGLKNTQDVRRG